MNFDLTDDQRAIQSTARDFLADRYKLEEVRRLAIEDERGFTDEQWSEIVSLGWPGLAIDEDDGGQGLGVVELAVVFEQLGYALAPTPLFSTTAAGLLLAASVDAEQRGRWLAPIASGERRGTVALYDEQPLRTPMAGEAEFDDGKLTATRSFVPDAGSADTIVVVATGDRAFVVEASAPGVTIEPLDSLDPTRRLFKVSFDGAAAEQLDLDVAAFERGNRAAVVALAAESVGVAQRALDMAVAYAKERKQFNTPIGAFQAVAHACAQMLLETEGARSTILYAAWTLDSAPDEAPAAASLAKAYASDAGWRVTASALQVHGGIGFTWEHDLHFFLKRARANAALWGDARWHRERVAQVLAARELSGAASG
jgi:alkylation response protein AidB-like acyl-CoA dehydrogenase